MVDPDPEGRVPDPGRSKPSSHPNDERIAGLLACLFNSKMVPGEKREQKKEEEKKRKIVTNLNLGISC